MMAVGGGGVWLDFVEHALSSRDELRLFGGRRVPVSGSQSATSSDPRLPPFSASLPLPPLAIWHLIHIIGAIVGTVVVEELQWCG